MRNQISKLKSYLPWLFFILLMDGFSAMLLWLADIKVFQAMFTFWILTSVIVFFVLCYFLIRNEIKKEEAFLAFFFDPDEKTENELLKLYGNSKKKIIRGMAETLYQKREEIEKTHILLSDYEDYVEVWTHEIKLPLSLLSLIIDNQGEELPKDLAFKLNYVRNQIQDNIARILFYYRVRGEKKDYFFEEFDLKECVEEVLADHKPLLEEKKFYVDTKNLNGEIYTDYRGFSFIVGQILSNAIKYSKDTPCLEIFCERSGERKKLVFRDNGCGVKACDFPHIFEKGFTGGSGSSRNKATGMGLYLVKQLTDDLKIEVEARSDWGSGFEISFCFPE